MAKKQIINPYLRFGSRAQGPYANRITGTSYAIVPKRKPGEPPIGTLLEAFADDGQLKALKKGQGSVTFSRTSQASITDFQGTVKTALENELRFERARRVRNKVGSSEDFSTWWTQVDSIVVDDAIAPNGTLTADKVTETSSDQNFFRGVVSQSLEAGDTFVWSIWLKLTGEGDGNGTVNIILGREGAGPFEESSRQVTLTSSWQRFAVAHTYANQQSGVSCTVSRRSVDASTVIHVWGAQVENGNAQTASDYVSVGVLSGQYHGAMVDGVAYFDNTNRLTIDSNTNVVSVRSVATWNSFGDATSTLVFAPSHYKFTENETFNGSAFGAIDVPSGDVADNAVMVFQATFKRLFANYNAYLFAQTRAGNSFQIDLNLGTGTIAGTSGSTGVIDDYGVVSEGGDWYTLWVAFNVESGAPSLLDLRAHLTADTTSPYFASWNFTNGREIGEIRDPYWYQGSAPILSTVDGYGTGGQDWYALFEPASTNQVQYSQDLTNAWWFKGRCTIGGNTESPRGSNITTAGIIATTENNAHYVESSYATGISDNTVYCFSALCKAGARTWVRLVIKRKNNTDAGAYFELTGAGTVGTVTGGPSQTVIERIGDYYLCSISADVGAGATTPLARLFAASADNNQVFAGDGVTVDTYACELQLEQGQPATSRILTAGSTVSRTADDGTEMFQRDGNFNETNGMIAGQSIVTGVPLGQAPWIGTRAGNPNGVTYYAVTDKVRLNDGMSQSDAQSGNAFVSGEARKWAGGWGNEDEMWSGMATGSSWTFGNLTAFDGAMPADANISVFNQQGASNPFPVPVKIRNMRIYDKDAGPSWIEQNY